MDINYLLTLYGTACITTWVFLLIFYIIYTHERRLTHNNFTKEYMTFIRKDYKKRSLGIAIAIPVLLLSAYSIYWLINGFPTSYYSLIFIFLIFLILVIPFPILDIRKSRKEYKKLAMETGASIVIDMKFKVLHTFFNPAIELIFFLLFIGYFLLAPNAIPLLVFIHLIIPWLIYLSARGSKFLTRPLMKDGYFLLFIVITVNNLIVLFYIVRYGIICLECSSDVNRTFSIVLITVIILKIFYSLFNFMHSGRYYPEES